MNKYVCIPSSMIHLSQKIQWDIPLSRFSTCSPHPDLGCHHALVITSVTSAVKTDVFMGKSWENRRKPSVNGRFHGKIMGKLKQILKGNSNLMDPNWIEV